MKISGFSIIAISAILFISLPPSFVNAIGVSQGAKEIKVHLYEYGFKVSSPIDESKIKFHFENGGENTHEVVFIRLNEGVTGNAYVKVGQTGASTRELGSLIKNAPPLKSGDNWIMSIKLKTGNYIMTCFVADEKTGKSHFMLGMVHEFSVL